jgi:cytochrome bd-type quinol oxidase subunit 2
MNWDMIFGFANAWALLGWVILALAPKREIVVPIVFFAGSVLLACLYAGLIIPLMAGLISDGGPTGRPAADLTSLAGVMALFDSPGGATIGWIHYLAFDLLVGIWIARNADAHKISRWFQIPILFFTLMAGPIGLLLYLLLRQLKGEKPDNAVVPS